MGPPERGRMVLDGRGRGGTGYGWLLPQGTMAVGEVGQGEWMPRPSRLKGQARSDEATKHAGERDDDDSDDKRQLLGLASML